MLCYFNLQHDSKNPTNTLPGGIFFRKVTRDMPFESLEYLYRLLFLGNNPEIVAELNKQNVRTHSLELGLKARYLKANPLIMDFGSLCIGSESFYSETIRPHNDEKVDEFIRNNWTLLDIQRAGNGKLKFKINKDKYIIVNANLGTTMKGGIDNTQELYRIIQKYKVKYYMHADGALSGFYLPFLEKDIFFKSYINSMSISGHKFLGIPFPCGIFIMEKRFMDLVSNDSEYIGSKDYMISCSRNGHSALFFKHIIDNKKTKGFKKDVDKCIKLADYATSKIEGSWRNRNSITVVFPKPSKEICKKWQLATEGNIAHIITMPNITKEIVDEFIHDLVT